MKTPYLEKAEQLKREARFHLEQGNKLMDKAMELHEKEIERIMRKSNDKMINRTQALELLWFDSLQNLKDWEKKVRPKGYLRFDGNKILRSEVLRFQDAFYNGKQRVRVG